MVLVPTWTVLLFEDHVRRHRRPCEWCEHEQWVKAGRPRFWRPGMATRAAIRGFQELMRRRHTHG